MTTLSYITVIQIDITIIYMYVAGLSERVFAEQSSKEQWQEQGDNFYKHRLYQVAAKCYNMSGDHTMEIRSTAQYRALEASRMRANPRKCVIFLCL